MVNQRSAALLIRVWFEDAEQFRARLLTVRGVTPDTPGEEVTVAVASSTDDVLDAVRNWLDGFTREAVDPGDDE